MADNPDILFIDIRPAGPENVGTVSQVPTFPGVLPTRALTQKRLRSAGLGAFFRPNQLEVLGIDYDQLRSLVAAGAVERVARGLYRLASAEPTENYSLAAVCARVPRSIVCLLSALRVHGIGTQLPWEVWLAIPHKARPPRVATNRIRLLRFSGAAWRYGVVDTEFEGVPARITSPARTVVDCFRYRNKVGIDVALEAARDALRSRITTVDAIMRAAEVCHARTVMGTYLEALVA